MELDLHGEFTTNDPIKDSISIEELKDKLPSVKLIR